MWSQGCWGKGMPAERLKRTYEVSCLSRCHQKFSENSSSSQQTIEGFTVVKKKPPLPVTKVGMKEYILELIVDGDLVSYCLALFLISVSCKGSLSPSDSLSAHLFTACYATPTQNSQTRRSQRKHVWRLQLMRRWWSWVKLIRLWSPWVIKSFHFSRISCYNHQNIQGLVSVIYNGWSSRCRRPFSSYSIQFVDVVQDDPYMWTLTSHLIAFEHSVGRHSGIMAGNELLRIIDRFGFREKVLLYFSYRWHSLLTSSIS